MHMHESKTNATRSSTSSAVKLSYSSGGSGSSGVAGASLPFNNQVTSSANNHSNTTDKQRNKKKSSRDRQSANDDKSTMSNLSSYSLIDDDHIDDQETINVGNLIIDLESDLEKEKFENEQANSVINNDIDSKCSKTPNNAPSSTSPVVATSSSSTFNKSNNNNHNHSIDLKSNSKSNQKIISKHQKDTSNSNTVSISNITNNNGHANTRTVFKSSADERGELKMKITRETKQNKNEHKVLISPSQKSPPNCSSSNSGGSMNNPVSVNQGSNRDINVSNQTTLALANISSTRECGTSTSIGTITEPECLGPCEPGTSVNLEGIVWQETDGGILVVNVTWRGKTYVGALLDCTRHDWAPPRLCDSPASDIDSKTSKGVRAKRIVTRSNGIGLDEKNLLQTTGKLRNGKGRRIPSASDSSSCNKKQRETSEKASESLSAQTETNTPQANMSLTNSETTTVSMNIDTTSTSQQEPHAAGTNPKDEKGPISPMLIGCTEPNCSKKFRNMNGLLYHQSHAHSSENESSNNQEDDSSSTKDKSDATVIEESPTDNLSSPNPPNGDSKMFKRDQDGDNERQQYQQQQHMMHNMLQPQGQKRVRTPSPEIPTKMSNRPQTDATSHLNPNDNRLARNESPRISYVKGMDPDRRHSNPSNHSSLSKSSESHRSPHNQHRQNSQEFHGSTSSSHDHHSSTSSSSSFQTSKSSTQSLKQSHQPPPPLPATTEEGMKPSGTSTGPPPAPHQANCYFNPTFLANTFNPYGLPPYFPRHMYDPLAPPNVPTSNAAFLTRFMNNMRVPPPADSPSRLLSPSIRGMPPNIPTSHPLPNMSPLSNPPLPPGSLPPVPPLPIIGAPANLRMPSQGDPLLPPSSQPPFLPPTGLNPALGLPGMGNPLGPMGGPQVPSLVDDPLAKQFPRRFN